MIAIGKIILYSLLVGFIIAGFVWYGWGLVQNINAARAAAFARKAREQADAAKESPADT